MHTDGRSDGFEQSRHDVDLHVQVPKRVNELELPAVALLGEGDDDPLDVVLLDERADLSGRAEHWDFGEVAAHRPRIVVHEPDEPNTQLGMVRQLPSE